MAEDFGFDEFVKSRLMVGSDRGKPVLVKLETVQLLSGSY
jgi:hypothetical protein